MAKPGQTCFLVLEDDADDALLIRRAFVKAECFAFVCRNTSEARAYLTGAGMYSDRDTYPFPDIFVTDLRLGDESGVNFLAWIRSQESLRHLTVFALSGQATPKDMVQLRALGVARFLQKPPNPLDLEALLIRLTSDLLEPRHAVAPLSSAA